MDVEPAPPAEVDRAGEPSGRRVMALRLLLLWLLGANLRTVILAVPPVLPVIHRQLHLTETEVGLLTTLPVLLFGVGAVGGSAAVARLGTRRTLVVGILVVGLMSALRGAGGIVSLFGASVLLGLSISVIQPVLPTVASAWFGERPGVATAVLGNGFVVGEALAASVMLPFVVPLTGSWEAALAVWALPCVAVALFLLTAAGEVPRLAPEEQARIGWSPKLGDRRTWRLGLFQGGGSVVYFGLNAFIPTELHAIGHGSLVGPCLVALNVTQLPASLVVGALSHWKVRLPPVMAVCGLVSLAGVGLVAFAPGPMAVLGSALAGVGSACGFVLAFSLPATVAGRNEVHQLSAGMFTIGYTMAFVLPLFGGVAWDLTGEPRTAFLPAAAGAVLLAVALARRPGRHRPDGEALGAAPSGLA